MSATLNYGQVEDALMSMQDFRGNSMSAAWKHDTGEYVIYSYRTPIAAYKDGVWWIGDTRYSRTTSRHQSLVRLCVRRMCK